MSLRRHAKGTNSGHQGHALRHLTHTSPSNWRHCQYLEVQLAAGRSTSAANYGSRRFPNRVYSMVVPKRHQGCICSFGPTSQYD